MKLGRLHLFVAFAFTVMADPVSSVAYAIEAALRELDGDPESLFATMALVVAIIAVVSATYAGLRPNDEHLLIQSQKLTVDDPEFEAAIEDAVARLKRTEDVKNVVSPLTGGAPISPDKHSAMVDFEITGDSLEAAKRLDPTEETVSAVGDAHPQLRVEQFGNVSSTRSSTTRSPRTWRRPSCCPSRSLC